VNTTNTSGATQTSLVDTVKSQEKYLENQKAKAKQEKKKNDVIQANVSFTFHPYF